MTAYLDASVLTPLIVEEAESEAVRRFNAERMGELTVCDFAAAEVASALSRLVRMRRLAADDAVARLADFDAWRLATTRSVDVISADVRLADAYVRRFELMLRAPDALHAAVCRRLGLTLVTFDRRLTAAGRELGVEVVAPA